jgi:glycogen operon protein
MDIDWFRPDGLQMSDDDWNQAHAKSVGVFLNGGAIPTPGPRGERIVDDDFLILFNAHDGAIEWAIPARLAGPWELVLDTDRGGFSESPEALDSLVVQARSVVLLMRRRQRDEPISPLR